MSFTIPSSFSWLDSTTQPTPSEPLQSPLATTCPSLLSSSPSQPSLQATPSTSVTQLLYPSVSSSSPPPPPPPHNQSSLVDVPSSSTHQNASDSSRHSTPATSTGEPHLDNHVKVKTIPIHPIDTVPPESSYTAPPESSPSTPLSSSHSSPLDSANCQVKPEPQADSQDDPTSDPFASIQPAYFYPVDGDTPQSLLEQGVPVFHPTMEQFRDFYAYCQAIDKWGMQSGIVKVVPPKEWTDSLPSLKPPQHQPQSQSDPTKTHEQTEQHDDLADLTKIRIKNAIVQHFTPAGSGVWRQTNVTRTVKVWNAKQWAETCLTKGQKGPEMDQIRRAAETDNPHNSTATEDDGVRTRSGRARPSVGASEIKAGIKRKRGQERNSPNNTDSQPPSQSHDISTSDSTPNLAPPSELDTSTSAERCEPGSSNGNNSNVASKIRKASKPQQPATTAQEWDNFDYKLSWTKEGLTHEQIAEIETDPTQQSQTDQPKRPLPLSPSSWNEATCREIEKEYWRYLNFGKPPMYGADLKGTLFDRRTAAWNVGTLDNVLNRLRLKRKLPGVNTPYLYWGMWRATFAYHVEDVDLYSINYIHFGAPKQWYSIRQADRQRFESIMAAAFPADSRRCPHFMRHKSYLASPTFLIKNGVRPLPLVHHAGEFVITYPYGYHSGFNLGYNCAESVNFALESWLDIGRKANYCHCDQAQNTVRIDVDAMLEESKELEEAERKREIRKMKEGSQRPGQEDQVERRRKRNEKAREKRKQKRDLDTAAAVPVSEVSTPTAEAELGLPQTLEKHHYVDEQDLSQTPCVFCPSASTVDLVPTPPLSSDAEPLSAKTKALYERNAHRLCASFIPETWVGKSQDDQDVVCGIEGIDKARFSLKCLICPTVPLQKMGAKIQCTRGRCSRSSHISCALVEDNGWFIDVCSASVADRLEGKRDAKGKKTDAEQTNQDDQDERLVLLCRAHNPLYRQAEEVRKAEELRKKILALPIPSPIKIKSAGGVFEAIMIQVHDLADGQGEVIIDDQGQPRPIKFSRVVLDGKPDAKIKDESEEMLEENEGQSLEDLSKSNKRALVSENLAATTEKVDDDATPTSPPKRRRTTSRKSEMVDATTLEAKRDGEGLDTNPEAKVNSASPSKRRRTPATRKNQKHADVDAKQPIMNPIGSGSETSLAFKQPEPNGMASSNPAPASDGSFSSPPYPVSAPHHHWKEPPRYPPLPMPGGKEFIQRGPRATYQTSYPGGPSQAPFNSQASSFSFPAFAQRYVGHQGMLGVSGEWKGPVPSAAMTEYPHSHPSLPPPSSSSQYGLNGGSFPSSPASYRHSPRGQPSGLPPTPPFPPQLPKTASLSSSSPSSVSIHPTPYSATTVGGPRNEPRPNLPTYSRPLPPLAPMEHHHHHHHHGLPRLADVALLPSGSASYPPVDPPSPHRHQRHHHHHLHRLHDEHHHERERVNGNSHAYGNDNDNTLTTHPHPHTQHQLHQHQQHQLQQQHHQHHHQPPTDSAPQRHHHNIHPNGYRLSPQPPHATVLPHSNYDPHHQRLHYQNQHHPHSQQQQQYHLQQQQERQRHSIESPRDSHHHLPSSLHGSFAHDKPTVNYPNVNWSAEEYYRRS